jgi:hypothetical protein
MRSLLLAPVALIAVTSLAQSQGIRSPKDFTDILEQCLNKGTAFTNLWDGRWQNQGNSGRWGLGKWPNRGWAIGWEDHRGRQAVVIDLNSIVVKGGSSVSFTAGTATFNLSVNGKTITGSWTGGGTFTASCG